MFGGRLLLQPATGSLLLLLLLLPVLKPLLLLRYDCICVVGLSVQSVGRMAENALEGPAGVCLS